MSDGMGRELAYLSSHATNRYFIPNWGKNYDLGSLFPSIWVLNKIKTGRMGIKLEEIE